MKEKSCMCAGYKENRKKKTGYVEFNSLHTVPVMARATATSNVADEVASANRRCPVYVNLEGWAYRTNESTTQVRIVKQADQL